MSTLGSKRLERVYFERISQGQKKTKDRERKDAKTAKKPSAAPPQPKCISHHGAAVFFVKGFRCFSGVLCGVPRGVVLEDGVEDVEEFPDAGDGDELVGFSGVFESLVEGLEDGVAAD